MPTLKHLLRAGASPTATLVYIDHPEGPFYLWDGLGKLEYDGQTWLGMGRLGSIAIAPFTTEAQIHDLTLTLSHVDQQYLDAVNVSMKGRDITIWKAVLDDNNKVLHKWVIVEAEGDQISASVSEDGEGTITLTAIAGFYFMEKQSAAVWDQQQQRDRLTGLGLDPDSDTGFDQMHLMKNKEITWLPE